MNKEDIKSQWSTALDSGSFLTPKHDPANLSITWRKFRTVLSEAASSSLETFIKSGSYQIEVYEDRYYPSGSGYCVITPSGDSPFSVAGSGVASGSITPSGSYDTLVAVYGPNQGWHVYAEDSQRISGSIGTRLNQKYKL